MKLTHEQLVERDERRRQRVNRIEPHWDFYVWSGAGWQATTIREFMYQRHCMRVRLHLTKLGADRVEDQRVCVRIRKGSGVAPLRKGVG